MQFFTTTLLALSTGLATAIPQDLPSGTALPPGIDNVPTCAYSALIALFTSSGCTSTTDTACICSKPELFTILNNSVDEDCTRTADQDTTKQYAASFCSSSSSSSTAASSTTSSVTPSGTSTAIATGGANSSNTSTTPSYTSPAPSTSSTETSTGARSAVKGSFGMGSMAARVIALGGMTWIFAEF